MPCKIFYSQMEFLKSYKSWIKIALKIPSLGYVLFQLLIIPTKVFQAKLFHQLFNQSPSMPWYHRYKTLDIIDINFNKLWLSTFKQILSNKFFLSSYDRRKKRKFLFSTRMTRVSILGNSFQRRESDRTSRCGLILQPSWERCTRPSKGELTIPELFIALHLLTASWNFINDRNIRPRNPRLPTFLIFPDIFISFTLIYARYIIVWIKKICALVSTRKSFERRAQVCTFSKKKKKKMKTSC